MDPSQAQLPKIILIDDEPSVLLALRLLLKALGYEVVDYSDPAKAIEFASTDSTCNVCICDLRMPSMSGLEVLQEMKRVRPGLAFVLMSAHAGNEEIAQGTELGANAFLPKPFTPDDLRGVMISLGLIK